MARDLMARELADAMRDLPQSLRLRLPSGAWTDLPVASDALPAATAPTMDGMDYAAEGVGVLVLADALPCAPEALVGRPAELHGRRLIVAAVSKVPGDVAVSLTLARRAVSP